MNGEQTKIQKVYLAILNKDQLRSEMTTTVIPAMQNTNGVKLIWENPYKTWANPISSNRNQIVKRFLNTDCDFLLMIDDDVVPMHNPCELVHADCDIIGSPALVRSPGNLMSWTAYSTHPDDTGYSAVDLDSIDDMFDLLEVAIVGTGCILVKRKVLEGVKAPFHSEFDEDGVQIYGTDFAFCRRATKAGFKVYTTVHRRCEHFKTVGLSDISAWDFINYFEDSNKPYGIPYGMENISQNDWHFIKKYLPSHEDGHYKNPIPQVLEFGAGLTSLLMSETCEVVCYETDSERKKFIESKRTDKNNLTIKLWDGQHFSDLTQHWDMNAGQDKIDKFDFAFIDGPEVQLKGGVGRGEAIRIASQVSDHIILHDAGRYENDQHQRKYLRSIFKLERKSGSHLLRCHYWVRRPKPVTLEDVKRQIQMNKQK